MRLSQTKSYSSKLKAALSSAPARLYQSINVRPLSVLGEARTHILSWYCLILGLVFLAGMPAFRYLLFQRVNVRIQQNVAEQMAFFQQLLGSEQQFVEHIQERGSERTEDLRLHFKATHDYAIELDSVEEAEEFFDQYLRHVVPEEHTFLLTFLDGEFYKSSPRGRPNPLQQDADLMQQWARQTQPGQGVEKTLDPEVGNILYMLEPIEVGGQVRATYVIAYVTAGEYAEVVDAMLVVAQVSVALFLVASTLAWFAVGRILTPLRTMTATAQIISETDLSRRLPVKGQGELAELAVTFNNMMNRLETAFASQRDFVNNAGHELRTPITVIQGHLELMGNEPDEQQETLDLVMGELHRMNHLINDLILLAKAERSDFLHLSMVDVGELTEELFTKAKALAHRDWQLDETAKGLVVLDRERFTEAVMNLAQNATQYTQVDDVISMGSTIVKGKFRFWVRDTGEGIPLPEQKQIFERFTRATNSRYRLEGCGLGLSIVKAITEAHGGKVLLQSKLGSGSMFILILPLDSPQEVGTHDKYPDC